ncbi:hypothetical protein PG993_014050 [Apiospora rasikravindrae]|uniref:Uncharacterized protein n=1 Tax=Apiospora rasikravindrae TaxID=990691 RepID=A0ABR1RRY2_9PEZI
MLSPPPRESIELVQGPSMPLDSQAAFHENMPVSQHESTTNVPLDRWDMPRTTSKSDSTTHESLLGHPKRQPPPRPFWERLGKSGLFILVIGTILLFGSVGNLLFLWIGAERASRNVDPGPLWRTIAFSGWITRTITISSAAMRAVITMQAAAVTSMISALFLESANTELLHLPLLSITRAVRLSPVSLLLPYILGRKGPFKATYSLIILLSSVLVVVSQFVSTILLSDFASIHIAGPENSTSIYFADPVFSVVDSVLFSNRNNLFGNAPSAFWRFAEYREDPENEENQATSGYADTGVTIRAAIPWAEESSRLRLMRYSGTARMWYARVLCVSPSLSNVILKTINNTIPKTPSTITGNFIIDHAHPNLIRSGRNDGNSFFNCSLHLDNGVVICPTTTSGYNIKLHSPFTSENKGLATLSFMVFKVNIGKIYEESPSEYKDWAFLRHGPWTTAVHPSDHEMFSASECFTTISSINANVTMSGAPAASEPTMHWPLDPSKIGYDSGFPDTSEIRRQLGVTREKRELSSRGLLALDPNGALSEIVSYLQSAGLGGIISTSQTLGLGRGVNWQSKNDIARSQYVAAHDVHTAIFLDILKTTNNPAYAIQALSTTLYQMQYFEESYRWIYNHSASYVMSQEISIPVQKTGLLVVAGIFAVHIVVVGTTAAIFLRRTRATLLGNVWQSVAQVISDKTTDILWRADSMTDKEVKEELSGTAYNPKIKAAGVIRRRQNGRNEFGSLAD